MTSSQPHVHDLHALLRELSHLGTPAGAPQPPPLEAETAAFLRGTWAQARDGLLARTTRVRAQPLPGPVPRTFFFELDLPYKRRTPEGLVELAPGPLRGTLRYAADLFRPDSREPSVAVFVDPEQRLFHPNHFRGLGAICCGDLPPGPFPLDLLLEHLYRVLSYADANPADPADPEAAEYLRRDPEARVGLEPVPPLYGSEAAS